MYANVLNHYELTFCSLQAVMAKPGFLSAATDTLLAPDSEANKGFFGTFAQTVVKLFWGYSSFLIRRAQLLLALKLLISF